MIGTHKVGIFHGHALGSRGLQLAAVSPVPTMVVPVDVSHGRGGVAVGVPGTPGLDEALRFAIREATTSRNACPSSAPRADGDRREALLELAWEVPEAVDFRRHRSVARRPAPARPSRESPVAPCSR